MINGPRDSVKRARKLRSEMSLPQTMLWRELRKRPGGFKFRREHPAGEKYTLDFYVASLRLDIEVDGSAHDSAPAVARDQARSEYLRSQRVATLRVPAQAILDDIDAVVVRIVQVCEKRKAKLALYRAAESPPPLGEGNHAQHGGGVRAARKTPRGRALFKARLETGAPLSEQAIPHVPLHQPPAGPPPRAGED